MQSTEQTLMRRNGTIADEGDPNPLHDYSGGPEEVKIEKDDLGATLGGSTGEADGSTEAGGWQGTDDSTSTSPSDDETKAPAYAATEPTEDPTGRAYGGGIDPEDGPVADLAGRPVEEARDWEENPI